MQQSLPAAESAQAPCPDAARLEPDVTLADGAHSIHSKLADPKHAFSIRDVKQLIHALRDLQGMIGTPVGAAVLHSDEAKSEELKLMLTGASRARQYLRQIVMPSIGGDQARTEEIELFGELQDALADFVFTRTLGVVHHLVQSCEAEENMVTNQEVVEGDETNKMRHVICKALQVCLEHVTTKTLFSVQSDLEPEQKKQKLCQIFAADTRVSSWKSTEQTNEQTKAADKW